MKKGPGTDDITLENLKKIKHEIAYPVMIMFNNFCYGKFPSTLKWWSNRL